MILVQRLELSGTEVPLPGKTFESRNDRRLRDRNAQPGSARVSPEFGCLSVLTAMLSHITKQPGWSLMTLLRAIFCNDSPKTADLVRSSFVHSPTQDVDLTATSITPSQLRAFDVNRRVRPQAGVWSSIVSLRHRTVLSRHNSRPDVTMPNLPLAGNFFLSFLHPEVFPRCFVLLRVYWVCAWGRQHCLSVWGNPVGQRLSQAAR